MKRAYSTFDYTVSVTRKYRYLTFSCPELGIQIGSECLDLGEASPEKIGQQILRLYERINARLHKCEMEGETPPTPLNFSKVKIYCARDQLSIREAAKALGVSVHTLREMVRKNMIQAARTPGGHLRFSLEVLTQYLVGH